MEEKEPWNYEIFKKAYNSLAHSLSVCYLPKTVPESTYKEEYERSEEKNLTAFARNRLIYDQDL